jgi:hypothetical protein
MSDETKEKDDSTEEIEKRKLPDVHDPMLSTLLDTFGKYGVSIGLTLIVDGTIVSGTTIDRAEFLVSFARQLDKAWPSQKEASQAWEKTFTELEPLSDEERELIRKMGWVHLKDATVLGSDGRYYKIPLWRGLLTHVGGWSLGIPSFE